MFVVLGDENMGLPKELTSALLRMAYAARSACRDMFDRLESAQWIARHGTDDYRQFDRPVEPDGVDDAA